MERGGIGRLRQAALERLDLPEDLPAGVPHLELVGDREFFMSQHRGVLSYSTERIEIGGGGLTICLLGSGLELVAMTGDELRIRGRLAAVELWEAEGGHV